MVLRVGDVQKFVNYADTTRSFAWRCSHTARCCARPRPASSRCPRHCSARGRSAPGWSPRGRARPARARRGAARSSRRAAPWRGRRPWAASRPRAGAPPPSPALEALPALGRVDAHLAREVAERVGEAGVHHAVGGRDADVPGASGRSRRLGAHERGAVEERGAPRRRRRAASSTSSSMRRSSRGRRERQQRGASRCRAVRARGRRGVVAVGRGEQSAPLPGRRPGSKRSRRTPAPARRCRAGGGCSRGARDAAWAACGRAGSPPGAARAAAAARSASATRRWARRAGSARGRPPARSARRRRRRA
jgi:hypothetical protein